MKAAGPSQSWAQFLRVEYMTLKSFCPWRNNMFSSLADSSAMQPTRCSILSFLFLYGRKIICLDISYEYKSIHNIAKAYFVLVPFLCCDYFGSVLFRWISVARQNLEPAVARKHAQINKYLMKYEGNKTPQVKRAFSTSSSSSHVEKARFKKTHVLFEKFLLSLSLGQKMIPGGISTC